jgi:nucleoside-diphosphate-sugar epimerase
MRVLVTGATGFVGSHLVRLLVQRRCEVTVLVRSGSDLVRLRDVESELNVVEADLLELSHAESQIRGVQPELCFHLAWYINPGFHANAIQNLDYVTASVKLLQLLDDVGCARTIITGTCLEQDASTRFLNEQAACVPRNFYAACKHALHVQFEHFSRRQGRGYAWARMFDTYGPGEYSGRLVPDLIQNLVAGRACALSDGRQVRDYMHVHDTVRALWAIAESQKDGDFNIGSGQPVSVAQIANAVGQIVGRPDLLRFGARAALPFDTAFCCADTARLRRDTSWEPTISLDSGLEQTVTWWRMNS